VLLSSLFSWDHLHPILVHFTTALLPASFLSDVVGKFTDRYSLTPAAAWMLLYGAIVTPLTALAGWMWATDIEKLTGGEAEPTLRTHELLGIGLVIGFLTLAIWRGRIFRLAQKPGVVYFVVAAIIIAALMYQGYIGGKMTLGEKRTESELDSC
jgi:uncharacterized membrane protein